MSASGPEAPSGYGIRPYERADLDALIAVERRSAALFAEHGLPTMATAPAPQRAAFADLLETNAAWVAETRAGDGPAGPVGYAVAGDVNGVFYLKDLAVDPAHGRRGLGSALLACVIDHAHWAFYGAVALSTFRNVPFNAPFYRRRGFVAVAREDVPEMLAGQFDAEVPPGIHPATRVLMVRRL